MSPQPWPGRRRAESLWATLGQDFESPIPDPDSPRSKPSCRVRTLDLVGREKHRTDSGHPPGRAGGRFRPVGQASCQKVPGPSPLDAVTDCPDLDRRPRTPLPRPTSQALTMSLSVPDMSAAELALCVSFGRPGSLPACSPRSRLRPPLSPPAAPPRFAQVLGSSPGLTAAGPRSPRRRQEPEKRDPGVWTPDSAWVGPALPS